MPHPICLCYHPTRVVFIDDNQSYMDGIVLNLRKHFIFQTFSDPLKAQTFFKSYSATTFIQHCLVDGDAIHPEHIAFNFDCRGVKKEAENVQRFDEIAVVIIDYAMPGMKGVDLARELKNLLPRLKIIMLTGEADEQVAIKAFNEGLIDQFIVKLTPDLTPRLLGTIQQLEHQYFAELSDFVLDKSAVSLDKRLNDPFVETLFNETRLAHSIVEYYLIDSMGSFLMLDKEGKPYGFILMNDQDVEVFYDIAASWLSSESEQSGGQGDSVEQLKSIVQWLKERKKLPFFFSDADLATAPAAWGPFFRPMQTLKTPSDTYYYALLTPQEGAHWLPQGFLSFQKRLTSA